MFSTLSRDQLVFLLKSGFKPGAPIEGLDLFAERRDQSAAILAAINQIGQHALLFGERGVGKTSLANVLRFKIKTPGWTQLTPITNCSRNDSFQTIWGRLFMVLHEQLTNAGIKLKPTHNRHLRLAVEGFTDHINMETVRSVFSAVCEEAAMMAVIDEFDLLTDAGVKSQFADCIKYFSDRSSRFTVILVGVADDVETLVSDHRSIERCLVQVRMPRMSRDELEAIVRTCLAKAKDDNKCSMTIDDPAVQEISRLSVGLPHYAHLLGLHSGIQAVDASSLNVTAAHVAAAIGPSLDNAHQTVQNAYLHATESSQASAIYTEVLTACAMAETNSQGYFSAGDVREPLSRILKKPTRIENFNRHLVTFCQPESGPVLEQGKFRGHKQFRFINPLMQPFALLSGLRSRMLTEEDLAATRDPNDPQKRLF